MIQDKQAVLGSAQAVTSTAGTTDYYDASNAQRDLGNIKQLYMVFLITTTVAASGGASTTTFQLQSDDNTSFSSPTTWLQSDAIAKATLVAGYRVVLPIPPGLNERYIRGKYVVATNDWTAGAVSCFITDNVQNSPALPDAL